MGVINIPATRLNYLVLFKEDSQVYGTANIERALETPPPPGQTLEDKQILFITYQPDGEILSVHPVPKDQILNAQIKPPKKKKGEEDGAS